MAAAEQPPPPPTSKNYFNVGENLPAWSSWSNNPADMKLDTYFNTDPNIPGLAQQFGLPGLKPAIVLKSIKLGDKYLLVDQSGGYFLWNELEPELWRLNFSPAKELSEIIMLVCTGDYDNENLVQQFNPEIARLRRREG